MLKRAEDVFADAKWIQGGSPCCEAPLFRKSFTLPAIAGGKIRICGLGFFMLWVNGCPVTEDRLVPGWSNYEKRHFKNMLYPIDDTFHNRIYYLEYDVSALLRPGKNVLAVRLGNGWYNDYSYTIEGDMAYGCPKLCYRISIEKADGELLFVGSDESTRYRESEILRNNIHTGEIHDLRLRDDAWRQPDYDDTEWKTSIPAASPDAEFCLQEFPADRVIRTLYPTLIHKALGRRIYDCGENITGYPVLHMLAAEGNEVVVRYSEEYRLSTIQLDFFSAGGEDRMQEDRCFCAAHVSHFHPLFTWHGFRYFEVIGEAEAEKVEVLHANIPVIASFESSNDTLNWLYRSYLSSQLGNLHCGVPSDCPHRERLGYTGDGQVTCRTAMFCLDIRQTYIKWMRDIVDSQDSVTGHVQHTAPFFGGGGGPGGWGGAVFVVPWQFYLHYGDTLLLDLYFPNILLWLEYMESCCEGGLVVREEEGGWCLGDWCAPDMTIPEPFVNTYYYVKGLETALQAGELLGREFNRKALRQRADSARRAMTEKYFDSSCGSFCQGANGADAFAVDLGLGDHRTLHRLAERYNLSKTLDTGIFGTDLLIDVLFREGYGGLAYELLTAHTSASFYRMQQEGATTLWEDWDGAASHNHPMFGGVVRSLFTYLLGIQQKDGTCGYREPVIRPVEVPGLDWVKGSTCIGGSTVSVSVHKDASGRQVVETDIRSVQAAI